jgi:hypothetical protein
MKEIRLSEILVPIRKTTRGKISENRNLRMNCRENLDSIYVIVYSLCNSSLFAYTVIVVAATRSNLNRVTGYPHSNWSCILSEFHMNAVIIPSICHDRLYVYQYIDYSWSSFHRIRRCLVFAAGTVSSSSLKVWHDCIVLSGMRRYVFWH